jgi:Outer membrane lipoprotein-sorting protein
MISDGLRLVIALLISWLWAIEFEAACSSAADARQIMDGVYKQDTSRDATWRAKMDVYDKKGTLRSKKFVFRKIGGLGASKTLVRFVEPAEVRGVGLLSINEKGASDRQWMYTPAIQRVRRIAAQERRQRFIGTDFTNEDMAERVLDDYTYKLIGEGELVDGRQTWKIEARPVSSDKSQYAYVYLWVPQDVPYTVLAEMYDKNGQRQRVLKASDLVKVSNIWVARRVEMSTPPDGTRTVLLVDDIKFNIGLKEDLFTQQALEKPDVF